MTASRVGIVGLGIMGSAYARHLIAAGFAVSGFDVAADALHRFRMAGGMPAGSPREIATETEIVITALATLEALDDAFFGTDGIVAGAAPGLVVLETSTFALDAKERVRDALAAKGAIVLDVPVSGTGAQAQLRDLTVFASGERSAYEIALPVMEAYARDVRYVGPFGSGSKLKYIANLLVTIHNLSTAEAVVLAEQAGIDPLAMLDALGESAATSRMLQVRGPMMAARCYEPATMKVAVHQKDIGIIAEFAASVGAPTPLFSQSALFYTAALARGHAEHDTAALVSVLRSLAGQNEER
jgi:3-hydroxyisobutyrate dehydrogenase-like beta-hydroxyacid dehydrogenase